MNIIAKIAHRNSSVTSRRVETPKHDPEMLYIGCVDARLDIVGEVGIPNGKALIVRNVAAVIPRYSGEGTLRDVTVGAALDHYLNEIPETSNRKKQIVVAGHTDCGGIGKCLSGCSEGSHDLPRHLDNLKDAQAEVVKKAKDQGWDNEKARRELEKESVRVSVANLLEYPSVKRAIAEGRVEVHGWLIDTASKRISEMHPQTKEFSPMKPAPLAKSRHTNLER